MYGAFWRILPGPWYVRLIIVLALVAIAVWALFEYAFPVAVHWIAPPADITVE